MLKANDQFDEHIEGNNSPKISEMLSKHKQNIMRYAQQFNVEINNDLISQLSSVNSQRSSHREINNNLFEDFDTSKFKERLTQISSNFGKFKNNESISSQTYHQVLNIQNKEPSNKINSQKSIYDEIKKKYNYEGNNLTQLQNESEELEKEEKSDTESNNSWRGKLKEIKSQIKGSSLVTSKFRKIQDHSKKANLKMIAQKYSGKQEWKDDFDDESILSNDEILKPNKSNSPRLDLDYEKIRRKYLDKNSPQQQDDEILRKSAEKLYKESISQVDKQRASYEQLPTESIDDLLLTLKNKFGMKDTTNTKSHKLEKENQQRQSIRSSKESPNIVQALKQSPKIIKQQINEHNIRKSFESLSLPKSSQNQNLIQEKFVHDDFRNQMDDIPEKESVLQKSPPQQEVQQDIKHNQDHQSENIAQNQIAEKSNDHIKEQKYITQKELPIAEMKEKFTSEQPQKQKQQSKDLKLPLKLTPLKQSVKLEIPKYSDFQSMPISKENEEEFKQSYNKELQDIQDTMRTIKQMSLIGTPEKQFNEFLQEELAQPQKLDYNHTMTDVNQEIDYNLSSSDEENNRNHLLRSSIEKPEQKQIQMKKQRQSIDDINESEISFCSSSEKQSMISTNRKMNDQQEVTSLELDKEDIISQQSFRENKARLTFRDQELEHLVNLVPLAEQRLMQINQPEQKREIQQSLMKINYLIERLRYLNNMKQ